MSKKPTTIRAFNARFPDDDACLTHLFDVRFGDDPACPKCGELGKFHKLTKQPAYTCNCGHHIHPMVGTPFERSRTSLRDWFYVMFLFTTTRNGVAAKEVQRQLGVTYKTAWRMCHLIRQYMGYVDGDHTLGGPGKPAVEADKTFIGGKDKQGEDDKAIVLGMTERDGGKGITYVIPARTQEVVEPLVVKHVAFGAQLMTDKGKSFMHVGGWGYDHKAVNHSAHEYVRGDAHTNTIEGFWANVKRMIGGTHVWVSKKHLQIYLWEAEYRHNRRMQPHSMFDDLLRAFPKAV